MKIWDVTVPIRSDLPLYPGDEAPHVSFSQHYDRGSVEANSRIYMSVHSGTHVDAPFHMLEDGKKIHELPVDRYSGPCSVVDLTNLRSGNVEAEHLEAKASLAGRHPILLLKTRNSRLLKGSSKFEDSYAGLAISAGEWLLQHGVTVLGVDYLSLEAYGDYSFPVHKRLFANGVVAIEGLALGDVQEGEYELLCFPILIVGAEGAPVRAVLRELDGD